MMKRKKGKQLGNTELKFGLPDVAGQGSNVWILGQFASAKLNSKQVTNLVGWEGLMRG
jgi:hypothetical protein